MLAAPSANTVYAKLAARVPAMRLYSGLFLFAYVLMHFCNHAFGIISPEAMDEVEDLLTGPWKYPPLEQLLMLAVVTHFLLATGRLVRRRTLRLKPKEWLQTALGLLIPILLFQHILGTRVAEIFWHVDPLYERVLADITVFRPDIGILQAISLLVVWSHGCIGIHYWLSVKSFYPRYRALLGALAVIIPTLALAGYTSAANTVLQRAAAGGNPYLENLIKDAGRTAQSFAFYTRMSEYLLVITILLALSPFVVRQVRLIADRVRQAHTLHLPGGRTVRVAPGATALEALREAKVPIASVCGGRGRCTTCRLHCRGGLSDLPAPNPVESAALRSINAPGDWRLACQIRPQADLAITPLLPANATASDGRRPGGLTGSERQVVVIFADLRDSTKLGETKMPYDVLFILNQFFTEMTEALRATGGYYAQFTGDGLMALYGLEDLNIRRAIENAIRGAAEMLARIEKLNTHLKSELPFDLRIGLGIHIGDAIVGEMGPPRHEQISAIGDSINTAARLEAKCKEHGVPLIISQDVITRGKLHIPEGTKMYRESLRGKDREVEYYALTTLPTLTARDEKQPASGAFR
ncbi:adenylate/guanylate cyclase domain-containing protein [uncultured Thalassospira sp.]|jgi:adenylate cyclase|uniref:adenylate/guanylate cyclase domain-containing protein n=1 Tax=uncultured Thalassospira sp. TaxID=404382 RepID=UPI0030DC901C|tara:strand:+ start:4485 stop:6230 length:1746 start_codon:yes stop_codon:yes gene_type:complete